MHPYSQEKPASKPKQLNLRVDNETFDEVAVMARELGIERAELVRQMIRRSIDEYKREKNAKVVQ